MFTLFFQSGPVENLTDARRSDTRQFSTFFHRMLDAGVYLACSQFEAHFVSAAHSDTEIDVTIEAAKDAFSRL
jgi:glutamate-1-semialdehyde 2,1-aminomutase